MIDDWDPRCKGWKELYARQAFINPILPPFFNGITPPFFNPILFQSIANRMRCNILPVQFTKNFKKMENRPIPVNVANVMKEDYVIYLKKHGVDPFKQSQSVSFAGKELMAWMAQTMPYADELRVYLGVYPPTDPNAGRITVILWPYKNGKPATQPVSEGKDGDSTPIPPYNQGGLEP